MTTLDTNVGRGKPILLRAIFLLFAFKILLSLGLFVGFSYLGFEVGSKGGDEMATIILWTTEFGRMPSTQGSTGRDHNPHVFTNWLCGGGIRGGVSYGESDEVGYKAAVDRVHVNDLHATILHLLGMNHEELTYRYNGRDFRLTDVGGVVIDKIIA